MGLTNLRKGKAAASSNRRVAYEAVTLLSDANGMHIGLPEGRNVSRTSQKTGSHSPPFLPDLA